MSSRGRLIRTDAIPRLTLRGAAFTVLAVLSITFSYALDRIELLYLGCFLALFPALSALLLLVTPPKLSVVRRFVPDLVEVDGTVRVTLALHNSGARLPPESTWSDALPDAVGTASTGHLSAGTVATGAAERTTVHYSLCPPRRGIFDIGPLSVVSRDPFGLVARTATAPGTTSLTVTPSVTRLPDMPFGTALSDGSATQLPRSGSLGDDDLITREYRPGDAKRRVHWRATARHGELMVRQEEPRSNPEAVVLIDTRPRSYPDARGIALFDDGLALADDFERAVALGASVALHLQRTGYGVDVLHTTSGRRSRLRPHDAAGDGGAGAFLTRLAALDASARTRDIDFAVRLTGELRRFGTTPLFAVLGSVTPEDAARLAALRALAEPAVAFVVTNDTGGDDLVPLRDAGWLCVRVGTMDDLNRAWSTIGERVEASE
ncbi:DUF58 domain-containing protein [Planctomonas psychrotolerans]|uniref:DUF58 domain-containing protein n=1 Tax=Planctomonas psychrotolerans TaxID=2528712 RepID=UPI00123C3B4C|nr:DUF58 domain-containing protein [Planctomonas psychrotolerans]